MNAEIRAIVRERLEKLTEIDTKHLTAIEELLASYCQGKYLRVGKLESPLDLTTVSTIEYVLNDALTALLSHMTQYIALLDEKGKMSPLVYINEGYRIIETEIEKKRERISDIEQSKNMLKPEPNWPYPCKYCKEKKVYFSDYCGRSLDECMILKFECLKCGRSWHK
jgi:DNA-directed RNA polymerase subunit M/transcription elongation factor TFIIS